MGQTERGVGEESLTSEGARFDTFATSYAEAINRDPGMRLTGESFDYYLQLRLGIVAERLRASGVDLARGGAPSHLLDFGCGAGETQVAMRQHFPEAHLIGVDASAVSIRVARERGLSNAEFTINDGLHLAVPDGSVDVAYSNGTFHHVDHAAHQAIAREIFRAMKPGGNVFMFENNGLNPIVAWVMKHNELDQGAKTVPFWNLRRTFEQAGFRIRAVHFYAFFPKLLEPLRRREGYLGWLPLGGQYLVWGQKV